jgi:2-C-methyl-D-erythritol 4-phosphate cytidylyltransferase / 2-C-methyl-D-erythritol 2,4-cyclodiphosphate synthase
LSDFSLIILAAGNASRFNMGVKKQWIRVENDPLWLHVVKEFESLKIFSKIVIVSHKEEALYMQNHTGHLVVEGGSDRQYSLKNALEHIDSEYVLVSDAARACISETLINSLISHKDKADCIVPYLPLFDTTVYQKETINRDELMRIQTPQLSKTSILRQALDVDELFTDDSSAIVANGGSRHFVLGNEEAHKLTTIEDLKKLPCLNPPNNDYFVGSGFDVHAFEDGKRMQLAAVYIDNVDYGFKAHSDGDVAIHALIDAILGASGMDDIGTLFPDNDPQYKGIDSKKLLQICYDRIVSFGFELTHVDLTIMAEQPKVAPFKRAMRENLSTILNLAPIHVNVKATTTEKLGFVGRKEGVAVSATATLKYYDWTKK